MIDSFILIDRMKSYIAMKLRVVHGLGRPTGWVELGRDFLAFWWVGLSRRSETFSKILKLGTPIYNLIIINADK